MPRRGSPGQIERRLAESEARLAAVSCAQLARGVPAREIASALGVHDSTLRRWKKKGREVGARGAPPHHASPIERREIVDLLVHSRGAIGLPTLRRLFPAVARAELVELSRRVRRVIARRYPDVVHVLRWRVGAVWAMDFTRPPRPIDGRFPRILYVRDLGSACTLLALPCEAESAVQVARVLERLFEEHGAPLVLKRDNGSPLAALCVESVLARSGVLSLPSPPYTPQYNGACERSLGWLGVRAKLRALERGDPWTWTCEDVEAARLSSNHDARPWGARGLSPAEALARSSTIGEDERSAFARSFASHYAREIAAHESGDLARIRQHEEHAIRRIALRNALIQHGHLQLRTRRLSPSFSKRRASNIP